MARNIVVFLSYLAAFAVYVNAGMVRRTSPIPGPWTKISDHPVCFHGKDNKHGTLKYSGISGMVGALKLVHRSGFVRCAANKVHNSRWGCAHLTHLTKYPLNVIITDISNHIIYPVKQFFKPGEVGSKGLWYYLPATDTLHDKQLVFTNYETPFYLRHHATLRVWYGEDLMNQWEGDNGGRVCVDVFAHVL